MQSPYVQVWNHHVSLCPPLLPLFLLAVYTKHPLQAGEKKHVPLKTHCKDYSKFRCPTIKSCLQHLITCYFFTSLIFPLDFVGLITKMLWAILQSSTEKKFPRWFNKENLPATHFFGKENLISQYRHLQIRVLSLQDWGEPAALYRFSLMLQRTWWQTKWQAYTVSTWPNLGLLVQKKG
jgi:hypothetical protein